jgi:predicted AlkP superfamily pyrophosphatase or phosphodiesterase
MAARKKLGLFVFIDAFGWEILQRHAFLDDLLATRAPLQTVLGYSSTCDPTILTGKSPQEHGHFSFFYYNPAGSPFRLCRWLALLPHAVTRRGRVRRLMSRMIRRYYGYTGYFQIYNMPFRYLPLFDYSEKRDLYQSDGINAGVPTIFDHLREEGIPFYLSDWRRPETENLSTLQAALAAGRVAFAYLYLAAMDADLHAHGTRSAVVAQKIRWYEEQLRGILRIAETRYDPVHLYVFSDHGMTDVTAPCSLLPRIFALGLTFGRDYAAVFDSTMVRFWFLREGVRERIVEVLAAEPAGRVLTDADLERYGCAFPGRKYGEVFFLAHPGILICPSFMGETLLAGMHGYDPGHKDSVAMFASNVTPSPMPRGLADLYTLMKTEADA